MRIRRRQKLKTNTVVVIDQQMLKSKAWLSLGGAAPQVYLIFRTKCRIGPGFGESGRRERMILNNGQLVFTYVEAMTKYGLTGPRFTRALDQLIDHGFLDVASSGMGIYKSTTMYGISERWKLYGTPDFVPAKRPAPSIRMGFQGRQKRFSTNEIVRGSTNENVRGEAGSDSEPRTKTCAAETHENAASVL